MNRAHHLYLVIVCATLWVSWLLFGCGAGDVDREDVPQVETTYEQPVIEASIGGRPLDVPAQIIRSVVSGESPEFVRGWGGERGIVRSVVDGDTISVEVSGVVERVRYIGIDTPETVHPSKPVECLGVEAAAYNRALVEGREVTLVRDTTNRDRYGRLLRYVYVDDVFVNEVLVREGYATVYTYPPDVQHDVLFRDREREARTAGVGLWSGVCDDNAFAPSSAPIPNPECSIKGNINAQGEKIYHAPGCKSYEKTVIDESSGERWFCTEVEAKDAGWRRALNCT